MYLKILELENFRQFKGKQKIDLTTTKDKNIIIIHGENGSGKTTLLEAFSWCLYGELSLTNNQNILNEYVFFNMNDNESKIARVTLIFTDKGKEYIVSRSVKITNINNEQYWTRKDMKLEMTINGKSINSPQDTINKILNKELKKYFFFDGERIDKLAKRENSKDIQKGIRYVMGLEIFTNAIKHLKEIHREFKKELEEISQNENMKNESPIYKKGKLLEQSDEIEQKISDLKKFKELKQKEKHFIIKQLEQHKEIEKIEKERQFIEKEIDKQKTAFKEKLTALKEYTSTNSYLAISSNLFDKVKDFLEEKRQKGELPSGIKEQFIRDLLEKGECICGTKIKKGDKHYINLQNLLNKSVKKSIEDNFITISGTLEQLHDFQGNFIATLKKYYQEKNRLEESITLLEQKHLEIIKLLQNNEKTKIKELALKLEELNKEISNIDQEIGRYIEKKDYIEKELKKIEIEIKKYQALNEKIKLAERRLKVTQMLLQQLTEDYNELTTLVKNILSKKVKEVFSKIIRAEYYAEIDENFTLKVTKIVNGKKTYVGTSTGENQIASLSFIGSLVHIAKKLEQTKVFAGGGIYPIVMDSPFGTLDPEYRDKITKHIQELAPQIIILLSKSQWSKEVEKNLSPYINHEYILVYHNPKYKELDNQYKTITLDNQTYELEEDSEYEYTEIKGIK